MAYVNPQTQSLKLCFQTHYSLPYFQREYKWESRHFAEMLNDIQGAFLLNYDPTHGRKEVSNYSPYFLGSIITSTEKDGKKPLIDGQQRLTSTFLLLAYLERYRRDNDIKNALDLSTLLGSVSFGAMDYSIEFSPTRKALFDKYLDYTKAAADAMRDAEDIPDLDDGDKKILEALRTTEKFLDSKVRAAIAYFIDYVVERLLLIDLSVTSESEAHRVFVTMNDRGLRLGPIDLLKGQILSKIMVPAEAQACHSAWVNTINRLRGLDPEEDSLFFRNLFRAKWADTMRGKSKGDPAGDYDTIGDAYHRWFEENTSKLSIATADDYVRFARYDIPKFADMYSFIKTAESDLKPGYECIYFNAARKYSFQPMVLLAPAKVTDNTTDWQKKIALIARLIDLILTTRTIEGKENNYDNLKEISFSLAKSIRDMDHGALLTFVRAEWAKHLPILPELTKLKYAKADRSDILYLLARIACHLEDSFAMTTRVGFATYWQRDRGAKTFDVEHLLKEAFDPPALPPSHGFTNAKDYAESRNLFGALALLPRSRNRSLQDKPYRDKLVAYATENVLTQTLCPALYQNVSEQSERGDLSSGQFGTRAQADSRFLQDRYYCACCSLCRHRSAGLAVSVMMSDKSLHPTARGAALRSAPRPRVRPKPLGGGAHARRSAVPSKDAPLRLLNIQYRAFLIEGFETDSDRQTPHRKARIELLIKHRSEQRQSSDDYVERLPRTKLAS
jgi:hypothetical protein